MGRGIFAKFAFAVAIIVVAWTFDGCGPSTPGDSGGSSLSADISNQSTSANAATVYALCNTTDGLSSSVAAKLAAMPESQRQRVIARYIDELKNVEGRIDKCAVEIDGVRLPPPICEHESYIKLRDSGMVAIPQLIECVRKNNRSTRSNEIVMEYVDGQWEETTLTVRNVAMLLIEDIIGMNFIDPMTGEYVDVRKVAPCLADVYQNYYDKYGRYGKPECYYRLILDANADICYRSAAAKAMHHDILYFDIGRNGDASQAKALRYFGEIYAKMDLPSKPPTLAMAILSLAGDALKVNCRKSSDIYKSHLVLLEYDGVLELTGKDDPQFKAEIIRRFNAATQIVPKMFYATINYDLGNKSPVEQLCTQLAAGNLPGIPANPDKKNETEVLGGLSEFLGWLVDFEDECCKKSLRAVLDRKNSYYWLVRALVRDMYSESPVIPRIPLASSRDNGRTDFYQLSMADHFYDFPYFLSILVDDLSDETSTGWKAVRSRNNDGMASLEKTSSSATTKPFVGRHDKTAVGDVDLRICDLAAVILSECVIGLPYYHALSADAPQRLATIRERMKLYLPVMKSVGYDDESSVVMRGGQGMLFGPPPGQYFFPAIAPLGRPATADDVVAGKAIFHLGGKGKLNADVKLPGVGKIERPSGSFRVVIVQAEIDENGKTHLGAVSARDIIYDDKNDITYEMPLGEYIDTLKIR